VYQGDEPKAQAFPSEVVEALAGVAEEGAAPAPTIPGSRRMELRSRS
jgi:hypothetical protein